MQTHYLRRDILRTSAMAGTALSLSALSYQRVMGANERLRVASIGTGGKGWSDLTSVAKSPAVDVVALCDVDSSEPHLGRAAVEFPQAMKQEDWRRVLDQSKMFDAVIVSTPDFMHAPIALPAMALGKHVYCQKPLTHTVFEARQMQLAAKKYGVVTQMGNQIHSHTNYKTAVAWIQAGKIGQVRAVHAWQSGTPRWPRAIDRPEGADPIPGSVRWDLWQGVAGERPYKAGFYHPFSWRGWLDYGTGQLGDFGCHILDPIFTALQLTSPLSLVGDAPPMHRETWTKSATVRYLFPKTPYTAGETLPVTWYDGEGVTLVIKHVGEPKVFPEEKFPASSLMPVEGTDHYVQWADACRGVAKATANFAYAGPLTETVLLGTIAVRHPRLEILWDAANLRITNSAAAQALLTKPYRTGWEPSWV
jgi:predicted dehydrogenase